MLYVNYWHITRYLSLLKVEVQIKYQSVQLSTVCIQHEWKSETATSKLHGQQKNNGILREHEYPLQNMNTINNSAIIIITFDIHFEIYFIAITIDSVFERQLHLFDMWWGRDNKKTSELLCAASGGEEHPTMMYTIKSITYLHWKLWRKKN